MRPMLATPATRVPVGRAWQHEVKWDGMRVLADVRDGALRLFSRTERDVTVAFPELHALRHEYSDLLLDGEVVSLRDGVPSFAAIAERFHVGDARRAALLADHAPATLMLFDVLRVHGAGLLTRPWSDRRSLLERLELEAARWRTPPTFEDGVALHAATRDQGLEGVVSKRVDSPYVPGTRSPYWLKNPHRSTVSVVVGGWRPEVVGSGSRRLGAVLVGVPGPDGLRFVGRVGAGLAGRAGDALLRDLVPLATDRAPFVPPVPREDAAGATWVRPAVVVDVASLGLGGQGRLRLPAFKGVRTDLVPGDVDPLAEGE